MSRATRLTALVLLAVAGACAGPRVTMHIIDGERVALQGKRMSWDEFDKRIRTIVKDARSDGVKPPVVVVEFDPAALGFANRVADLLQDAGVKAAEFEVAR